MYIYRSFRELLEIITMDSSQGLVEALRKQPFEPLELQLPDGERIRLT